MKLYTLINFTHKVTNAEREMRKSKGKNRQERARLYIFEKLLLLAGVNNT